MKVVTLVHNYVSFKRSLGMRYRSQAHVLEAFARHTGNVEIDEVTVPAARSFIAGRGPVTASWHQRHAALNGLYRFAVSRDIVALSPLPLICPKRPPERTPHIYSVEELRRLIAATACLTTHTCPSRGTTFGVLLTLLYGSALRIGEALALTLNDVSLSDRLLTVRETKFYKQRWVPIGPQLTTVLKTHIRQRSRRLYDGQHSALLAGESGRRLSYSHVRTLFRQVRREARVICDGGPKAQPRLHDFRHTAAVHRVVHWYRTGKDVQRLLLPLATFLGHISIVSTQRYLTMTPELLHHAARRFEGYAWGGLQ